MDRPPLEVADLVRAAGDAFIERSRKWISWKHVKVLLAIARCRTAALGGHLDECTRCGHRAISFVVYAKPPFGGPEHVLRYLGRYTHRVAISNHRLISFAEQKVTFRWRDSVHKNEQRLMTLSLDEFLRRFLLHLLPDGFVRIRHFGFLANRRRATTLPLCFQLLGAALTPPTEQDKSGAGNASDLWLCPKCAGPMVVVERLTAAEMQLRSPPLVTAAP